MNGMLRQRDREISAGKAALRDALTRETRAIAALLPSLEVAIVGGGIAGLATALALAKRGLRSVVVEKDGSFLARSQGYGLTMQQGTAAVQSLGIAEAVARASAWSSRHFVFDPAGNPVAFWGPTFTADTEEAAAKGAAVGAGTAAAEVEQEEVWRTVGGHNLHIPRQELRRVLLEACQTFPQLIPSRDIYKRTRPKVLDSRRACEVLHHPESCSTAFHIKRKNLQGRRSDGQSDGADEGSTKKARAAGCDGDDFADHPIVRRVARMRAQGIGAWSDPQALDRLAFG
eukprot:g2898.t1